MLFGIENYIPIIRELKFLPFSDLAKYAFISILILIILHLMRPKPHDKTVPSIMFFIKEGGRSKRTALLQRLFANLLFFLQLLALLLLSFALLEPFITVKRDLVAENTVIIMDISASMAANDALVNGIDIAKQNLFGKISIILVSDQPLVALEKGNSIEANKIIENLKPKPFGSAIGESIRIGSEILGEEEGRIIVISDFLNTVGPKPSNEKEKVESKGQVIDFINVGNPKSNIGIIGLKLDKEKSLAFIKNFNPSDEEIEMKLNDKKQLITLKTRSIHSFPFNLQPGMNEIELLFEDDLEFDNKIFISTPENKTLSVLYISNVPSKFLQVALESSGKVTLQTAKPPIVPDINHDVIILGDIEEGKILPGTLKSIKSSVKAGKSLIFLANHRMSQFSDLLPVKINSFKDTKWLVNVQMNNQLTKDIIFGITNGFYDVEADDDFISFATAGENNTVLGFSNYGKGKIFYYGLFEDNNFQLSPSYPIFWAKMMDFLLNSKDLGYYNYFTGAIFGVPDKEQIITPSGKVHTGNIVFDEPGIYKMGDTKFAINFLDKDESDIFAGIELGLQTERTVKDIDKKEVDQPLAIYSMIAVILILIIELIYIKYRGDI